MYPCPSCDRQFGSSTALKQHEQNSSTHKRKLQCNLCDRAFGSEQALNQHRRDAPGHAELFDGEAGSRSLSSANGSKKHQCGSPRHQIPPPIPVVVDSSPSSTQTSEPSNLKIERRHHGTNHTRRDSVLTSVKSTKQKTARQRLETREYFTFPELHQSVADAIASYTSSSWFYENQANRRYGREHSTNVMGMFFCNNKACRKQSWGSKIVAMWIKEHPRNSYSAVVYNQRCQSCSFLGDLRLDKDCYVERVAYRLKRWAGVEMERPSFEKKKGPPHESALCEGCKRGVCPQVKGYFE